MDKLYYIFFPNALKFLLRAVKLALFLFCFSASINIQNNSKRLIEPFSIAFSEKLINKEETAKAVWKIEGNEWEGTGFFISKNQIVTNAHVVNMAEDIEEITIVQEGGPRLLKAGKIARLSIRHDLALLEVDEGVSDFLSLPENPLNSSNVYALGYPKGQFQEIKQTGVLKKDYFISDMSYIRGASGSPVLNEAHQLAGVLYQSLYNIIVFIDVKTLKSFIKEKHFSCEGNIQECFKSSTKRIEQNTQEVKSGKDFLNIYKYLSEKGDVTLAKWWMEKAAEKGFALAQYKLALMERGLHLKIELLTKAAEQGFPPAQYKLAWMYYKGEEVGQNIDKARELMEKAAEQGYAPAQHNLAEMYRDGEGGVQNIDKARELMKQAAEQGYAPAKQDLDKLFNSNPMLDNVKEMEKAPQKDNCRNIFRN